MTALRLFIVGPGRLGCSIAQACLEAPALELVGIAHHSEAGRERASAWTDAPISALGECEGIDRADLVLLTVRDDVIADAASAIAHRASGRAVAHTSGRLGSRAFSGVELSGPIGSIHPLQSFVDPATGSARLRGCVVALEGDDGVRQLGTRFARAVGAEAVEIPTAGKVAYHAAAVVASNYLVTITEMARRLYATAGIDAETGIRMLGPLQAGALRNLAEVGLPAALTGPIARADVATVESHLALIDDRLPALRSAYCALGRIALDLARDQDQDAARLERIGRLLED